MWIAPVLCAVISSFTTSAPTNSAISSRPRAGGPHAADLQPAAPHALHLGQPLLHRLDRPPRRAQVDVVDHRAELVDHHHVGGDRADVEAEVGRDRLAVGRRHVRPARGRAAAPRSPSRAACVSCTRSSRVVLAQPVDVQNRALARLLGLQNRRADGAAPGVFARARTARLRVSEKASRSAPVTPAFCDTAPISATGASTGRPFTIAALEVARHRVAQPAQNLGRRIALLLRVDHVALGEHRAASRRSAPRSRRRTPASPTSSTEYCMRSACWSRNDPGPGRALARAVVVQDARRSPGGCTWSSRRRSRTPCAPAGTTSPIIRAMALNSFSKNRPSTLAMVRLPRPGDAHAFHAVLRDDFVELAQQVVGGLDRAARDAPVIGEHQRAVAQRDQAELPDAPRTPLPASPGPPVCPERPA